MHLFIASALALMLIVSPLLAAQPASVRGHQFIVSGKPHYFIGTNYWYGSLLGTEADRQRGILRLRRELDLLKKRGVTNLRLMGAAEGSGPLNGVIRVGPAFQPDKGIFDDKVLVGLDIVLSEMAKRDMHAVIFLSNNWEWSGGFQQYLLWNGLEEKRWISERPSWDQLRDIVSGFYSCPSCKAGYAQQARRIITRTNTISGVKYIDDRTIFAWEIANEPRPMRPAANKAYEDWIAETAGMIKSLDRRHLVTIGHEGRIGTESLEIFERIHADKNVDYLTIHIWPKNWAWFSEGRLDEQFAEVLQKTRDYIDEHEEVARRLNKPLVIEEFGLPRDRGSFEPGSSVKRRDAYYSAILGRVQTDGHISGANFWAYGGAGATGRESPAWRPGDSWTGDPPMEEQGLNSVFDQDASTWAIISANARRVRRQR